MRGIGFGVCVHIHALTIDILIVNTIIANFNVLHETYIPEP